MDMLISNVLLSSLDIAIQRVMNQGRQQGRGRSFAGLAFLLWEAFVFSNEKKWAEVFPFC